MELLWIEEDAGLGEPAIASGAGNSGLSSPAPVVRLADYRHLVVRPTIMPLAACAEEMSNGATSRWRTLNKRPSATVSINKRPSATVSIQFPLTPGGSSGGRDRGAPGYSCYR